MPRSLKIVLNTLLWVGVVAFVAYFHSRADVHRASTKVHTLSISIVDSLRDEMLVTSSAVREWIEMSGIPTVGESVGDVDLAGIEQCIRGKGFVDRASAYLTYDGELRVEVSQRRPLMRLLVDGYDCYVTEQGFVFPAPKLASVYVPVITGSYRPPVESDYVGYVGDYVAEHVASYAEAIDTLQYEKVPLFEMSDIIADSMRAVRRMQVERKGWLGGFKGPFEDYDEYDARVSAKRKEKADLRRHLRYMERENDKSIANVTARQDAEREKQKKLQKRYEDFLKLINFVKYIENDSFWRAEVVQIMASTMSSGDLRVDFVPRSGSHVVRLGTLDDVEQKLSNLMTFYENGLRNIGWDSFRTISVEYSGQVVCTK